MCAPSSRSNWALAPTIGRTVSRHPALCCGSVAARDPTPSFPVSHRSPRAHVLGKRRCYCTRKPFVRPTSHARNAWHGIIMTCGVLLRVALRSGLPQICALFERVAAHRGNLPNNEVRDKFAAEYSVLGSIWEALSPDPVLSPYEKDYQWLTQVYESVKPPSGSGKLLWHALGAKTIAAYQRKCPCGIGARRH